MNAITVNAAAEKSAPTPMESLCAVVGAGALVFYWAEKGQNPAVRSYWDALHYVSTCLSVGYANVFPVTPVGKAVGAAIMMVGPALSAGALGDRNSREAPAPSDPALVTRLDAILVELRKLGAKREEDVLKAR